MIPGSSRYIPDEPSNVRQPTQTYRIDMDNNRISGVTDGLDAMKQAVFKILNTQRYRYLIYTWNYGSELEDLFGKPVSYVCAELERRIREALVWDKRIREVTDFQFHTPQKGKIMVNFTVRTDCGTFTAGKEVAV